MSTNPVCTCDRSVPFRRPSGLVVCANCGGAIVPKKTPEPRP